MKIDIHTKTPDEVLNQSINKKVSKLGKLNSHIIDASVYLTEEGHEKEVQIKIDIKNKTLVCKERGESFKEALDLSVNTMKRLLAKHKELVIK